MTADNGTAVDPWALVRQMSPNPRVRVARFDESVGAYLNSYDASVPVQGPPPASGQPYAIHLTDERGRNRLLGFDFDAKRGPVSSDVARLRALLNRAGLPHVVCASGPGGGRHVWVGLAEPVRADVVKPMAIGLGRMLPTYDPTPLTNPRTGALRPPLAPHRLGGRSEIVDGQLSDLLRPVAPAAAVLTLAGLVQAAQPPEATQDDHGSGAYTVVVDQRGHRRLRGQRRELSAAVRAALCNELPHGADTSDTLRVVLCGAVHARWRFAEIRARLDAGDPGLEHCRSRAGAGPGAARQPYGTVEQHRRLAAEWDRAVGYVSTHPVAAAIDDVEFEARRQAVTAAVAAIQRRADAAPGRWARPGGPADRRVLDVTCALMLAAVRTDIELDIRRAGSLAGMGREAARVSLHRLARDGWLMPGAPSTGVHGAHWALLVSPGDLRERRDAELSTERKHLTRSQGNTRPRDPSPDYWAWRSHLDNRTTAVLHDALTHAGLGHHVARVYQALNSAPTDLLDLMTITGYTRSRLAALLDRLAGHRLAKTDRRGRWQLLGRTHTSGTRLGRAARTLGVLGLLAERRRRYRIERAAWAWWTDELAWRRASAAIKRRSPGAGQLELVGAAYPRPREHHGQHPVDHRGRADYAAALAHLATRPTSHRQAS